MATQSCCGRSHYDQDSEGHYFEPWNMKKFMEWMVFSISQKIHLHNPIQHQQECKYVEGVHTYWNCK